MTGRPTTYSEPIAIEFCRRHADGESLESLYRDPNMPAKNAIWQWEKDHESFRAAFTHAQEEYANVLVRQTIDIVDTDADPQRARNRVAARQWLAGKLNREKYGEKVDVSHKTQVNVTLAIEDASARLRSVSDQSKIIESQAIEIIEPLAIKSSDYQSEGEEEVDIFS